MKYTSLVLLTLFFMGCEKSDPAEPRDLCGPAIIIDADRVNDDSDGFALIDASVEGRCLRVTIGTTACGSQGWELDLVTDGSVGESLPTQSSARLLFTNPAAGGITCQAEIEESYVFDLSNYLDEGALPTQLTLIGTDRVFSIE